MHTNISQNCMAGEQLKRVTPPRFEIYTIILYQFKNFYVILHALNKHLVKS